MIKENRIKKKYTQEELAEMAELSLRQLQRIERNQDQTRIKTLRKLITILCIPDDEVLDFLKKNK